MNLVTWDAITGKKVSNHSFSPKDRNEWELLEFIRFGFMKKGSDSNVSGLNDKALVVKPDSITEEDDFESTLTRYYDPEFLEPKFENQINYVRTEHDGKTFCWFRVIEIISPDDLINRYGEKLLGENQAILKQHF